MDPDRELVARVARLEAQHERTDVEVRRLRDRYHQFEKVGSAVALLTNELRRFREDLPDVARRIATETVVAMLAERDEQHRRREAARRSTATFVLQILGGLTAVAGVATGVAALLLQVL